MEVVCELCLFQDLLYLSPLGALLDRAESWGDGGGGSGGAATTTTPAQMDGSALLADFMDGILCQVGGLRSAGVDLI